MPMPKGANISRGLAIVADLKAIRASDILAMMWLVVCTQTLLQLLPSEGCDRFYLLITCYL